MNAMLLFNYLVTVFLTLSMLSMLWKENPLYRFVQYSVVAVAASVTIISAIEAIQKMAISPILTGTNYWMIIPTVAGILVFTNMLGRKYNWLSRYPLGIVLGVGTALSLRGAIPAQIIGQMQSLIRKGKIGTPFETFNNILFIVMGFTALSYFFFYFMHRTSAGRGLSKIGRYAVMLAFGATFGTDLMMNIIFLTYVVMYVSILGVPSPAGVSYTAAILLLAAIGVVGYLFTKRKTSMMPEKTELGEQ